MRRHGLAIQAPVGAGFKPARRDCVVVPVGWTCLALYGEPHVMSWWEITGTPSGRRARWCQVWTQQPVWFGQCLTWCPRILRLVSGHSWLALGNCRAARIRGHHPAAAPDGVKSGHNSPCGL